MNAQLAPEDFDTDPAPEGARALLRSVVITDLCDSTALVDRLGDVRATELIRAHDRLLRGLIREHRGQEIDKTDGFLSLFERPIQAVAFALAYQRGLRAFSLEHGVELSARIGVHVGEVMTWQNEEADIAKGAKPIEVEGLAKPVAARLMGLALPGQILLSGVAYTLAHRAEGELGAALSRVQWKPHGRFLFKGVVEAVPVYEIGEAGIAPFKPPAWSGKAHREVPLWRRPAALALELLVLLAVVALPAWYLLKPQPAIAFAERDWVVLADLRNLTGDPRFDDSLEQAFRIGLEQSRHVNVLSDLQVRDTLQRMQRDSDDPVDRSTGAEIAMREGSRALILPTLAEVGGRLRFTAELVDPTSQATVYSEYADGRGSDSVLALLDEVNHKLRGRLGEAMAQISESSKPLDRVATADLDALRAFTRARQLVMDRKVQDAVALLERAVELDPTFATAHVELAVIRRDLSDTAAAVRSLDQALSTEERLTIRELRHARAIRSSLVSPPLEALREYRLLTAEFPDFYAGWGGYAWFSWIFTHDHDQAIQAALANVDSRNPRRGTGHYLLGALHLAKGNEAEAEKHFDIADTLGRRYENRLRAALRGAQRDYEAAEASLKRGVSTGLALSEGGLALTRAAFLADQGDARAARALLRNARAQLQEENGWVWRALAIAELSLVIEPTDLDEHELAQSRALLRFLASNPGERDQANWRAHAEIESLALLALSLGDDASAPAEPTTLDGALADYPELQQRHLLRLARTHRRAGELDAAIGLLQPHANRRALFAVRVELLQAYLQAGRLDAAETIASQLSNDRGLAYTEPQASQAFLPFNAYWSTRALLALAEAQLGLGKIQAAQASLANFELASPAARHDPAMAGRLDALRKQIAGKMPK